jgi:hypothetical protein
MIEFKKIAFEGFQSSLKEDENIFGINNFGINKKSSRNESDIIWRKITDRDRKNFGKFIKPINAEIIKDFIPKKNTYTFFLMNGNCHFSDFILEFKKSVSEIRESYFTTLSLNKSSFDVLDQIPGKKSILVSSYFLATDKANTIPKLKSEKRLIDYEIGFFRNHTKICLIKTDNDFFVLTGSANLRSSGTIEQFSIFNDQNLYLFNKNWIDKIIRKYNIDLFFNGEINTGSANFNFL